MAEQITNYQCPACLGPLQYSAASGKLECERVEWQIATVRGLIAELKAEGLENEAAPAYFNGIYEA